MSTRLALVLLFLVLSHKVEAVVPESGIYWRADEPGRAYYIDYQRGTIFFVAYAYEDGSPVFYSGSGTVREANGEVLGSGFPLFSALGYEPWTYASFDLYRTTGGACLTCATQPTTSQKIGTTTLFFDRQSFISGVFQLDSGQVRQIAVERFNFAFPDVVGGRLKDISGDWVFVDRSNPSGEPLRFNFTVREQSVPIIDRFTPRPWEIRLIDVERNARWVCSGNLPGLDPSSKPDACELRVNGEAVLWARFDDIGLNRILAGRGQIRSQGERFRGPDEIIGMRIQ